MIQKKLMRHRALLISILLIQASFGGLTSAHAGGFACFAKIKAALESKLPFFSNLRRKLQKQELAYLIHLRKMTSQRSTHPFQTDADFERARESIAKASNEVFKLQEQRYREEGGLRVIPMQPEYIGESIGIDPYRMQRHESLYPIYYPLDEVTRGDFQLGLSPKGHFVDFEGKRLDGIYEFVMDQDGQLFGILRESEVATYYRHSSFLSGLPVASAGELKFVNGRLVEVSGQSGHYQPSQEINQQLFEILSREKIDTSKIKYSHLTRLAN